MLAWLLGCPADPPAPAPAPIPAPAPAPAAAPAPPRVSDERAVQALFPEGPPAGCDGPGRIRCLIAARYAGHPDEQRSALALYDELGDVAGLEVAHDLDGGFRGLIHLVPELPVGRYAEHLGWVLAAQRRIRATLEALGPGARYRHAALVWRFTRSVGRTTPSAYASGWEVGYNVVGSLLHSEDGVRTTVIHEVFHLDDEDHGWWSRRVLGPRVDAIDARCHNATACLAPYAPTSTRVRGGTYYAFQHDNGDLAVEYAAELATRYFEEQWAAIHGQVYPGGWFACGPPENRTAMEALSAEFFGGADRTPPCAPR
jgi:hypothetical protein